MEKEFRIEDYGYINNYFSENEIKCFEKNIKKDKLNFEKSSFYLEYKEKVYQRKNNKLKDLLNYYDKYLIMSYWYLDKGKYKSAFDCFKYVYMFYEKNIVENCIDSMVDIDNLTNGYLPFSTWLYDYIENVISYGDENELNTLSSIIASLINKFLPNNEESSYWNEYFVITSAKILVLTKEVTKGIETVRKFQQKYPNCIWGHIELATILMNKSKDIYNLALAKELLLEVSDINTNNDEQLEEDKNVVNDLLQQINNK